MYFQGFKCTGCGHNFSPGEDLLLCPDCQNLLEAVYDLKDLKRNLDMSEILNRDNSIWRWKELMPVIDFDSIISLGEGGSPLIRVDEIARELNIKEFFIMNDASLPSGSLKDRSIAVTATKAIEFGYPTLSCDSTGNKAASVAAYAAKAGLKSVVFCPWSTPSAKIAQAVFYGAKVIRVKGHYSEINDMYRRLIRSGKYKWYDCGTDNPFRYEGKKSYAYEIAHGLSWKVPTKIFQPAAGGMSIVKARKGFHELKELGLTVDMPAFIACQAAACAPIVESWKNNEEKVKEVKKGETVASAIAVSNPGILGDATLAALYESGGAAAAVEDEALLSVWKMLGRYGFFCEPSSAVSVAAAYELARMGKLDNKDVVVCVLTGSGFKDMETLVKRIEIPDIVAEGFDELEKLADSISI